MRQTLLENIYNFVWIGEMFFSQSCRIYGHKFMLLYQWIN